MAHYSRNVGLVLLAAVLVLGALMAVAGPLAAQAPAGGSGALVGYRIERYTIDGGGVTTAMGGAFTLSGAAGQADAGEMTGGDYRLVGGFWAGSAGPAAQYRVYLPLVVR